MPCTCAIRWQAAEPATRYHVEFALAPFYGVVHGSGAIDAAGQVTSYTVPVDIWRLAPARRSV